MNAAGPSQSWAQFFRVEYMTLKSFSPCLSSMFSSSSESSAIQPTSNSILSFRFLINKEQNYFKSDQKVIKCDFSSEEYAN